MVLSAAIVLPLVLDGERPAELDVQVQVTSPPNFPVIDIAPVQPVDSLPVNGQKRLAESESSRSEDLDTADIQLIPVPKPATDVKRLVRDEPQVSTTKVEPAAERWTVQIATFKSKDNTFRLVEKLKAANYDAYSVTTNSLYKVYVGPEFKRSTSEKMREDIKKTFKLNGIVIKYLVN
ncbi:SPOR domain-containing protein [Marinomonas sp. A79]|uniref:SPOR domain-containing protein n=2 Tax=Marinomonas vulgaris TaxID=2823372 RepID=A0ABS5HE14_9GAMM|nr:SPOR domain-containing protein [Marinomonas vulgaris]